MLSEKGFSSGDIADCGLIASNDRGDTYDKFRNRIIFPIRNLSGKTIAFGGRILGDGRPKYLNSPETPVFHKGRELYGLYEARQALRELPCAVADAGGRGGDDKAGLRVLLLQSAGSVPRIGLAA